MSFKPAIDDRIETFEDSARNPIANSFLIFQIDKYIFGSYDVTYREQLHDFVHRTPFSVDWQSNGVQIKITNTGLVASDLIKIEHQFIYCTYSNHQVDQGFSLNHAAEFDSNSRDSRTFLQFVPAGGEISVDVAYPIAPSSIANLKNLYFRARVSTLWEPIVAMNNWSFRNEKNVIESTKKF